MTNELKESFFLIYLETISDMKDNAEIEFNTKDEPPTCIFKKTLEEDKEKKCKFIQIFKYLHKPIKLAELDFSFAQKEYKITLDSNKTFIYNTILMQKTTKIPQNKLENYEKMNYFIEAVKKSNEEDKLNILFEESINHFSKVNDFLFLINIFINVYNTELCANLLKEFSENSKTDNLLEKDVIIKNNEYILNYLEDIYKNKEDLIAKFKLDKIYFNGLILTIYNNCFIENYEDKFNDLYKNDKKSLIEILLKYKKLFKNQINLDEEKLNEIIKFATSKSYDEFIINGLSYLKNINVFLNIIESNKNEIIGISNFKPIEMIKAENIEKVDLKKMIEKIQDILNFCDEKKIILINFNNKFWETMIKVFKDDKKEDIVLCYKFNNNYGKFESLFNKIITKKGDKKKSTKVILCNHLEKIIINYIKNNPNITNVDIIDLICNYDIYYQDENFISKRDVEIFELLNFSKIDDEFIQKFKEMKFEEIFKNKLDNFIMALIKKIKTIKDFDNILKLINIEKIEDKDIKSGYIKSLKDTYKNIINNTNLVEENKILIKSISKLIYFICFHENSLTFIEETLKNTYKFDKKTKHNIYIELINLCKQNSFENLNKFISEEYLKSININLEFFIDFLENLNEEYLNDFINKLDKKYIINESDIYSQRDNLKINLLNSIYQKKLKVKENNPYIKNNIEFLNGLLKNIEDKEIKFKDLDTILKSNKEIILKKLQIFQLIEDNYMTPEDIYNNFQKYHKKMKGTYEDLKKYRETLKYFEIDSEKELIDNNLQSFSEQTYKDFDSKSPQIQRYLSSLKIIIDKINLVKNSEIFKALFDKKKGNKSNVKKELIFETSFLEFQKFKKIIDEKGKDYLKYVDDKDLKNIIKNTNDEKIQDDLRILLKDKIKDNEEQKLIDNKSRYVRDLKAMLQFLSLFYKIEDDLYILKKKISTFTSKTFSFETKYIKTFLNELKEEGLYDYTLENYSNEYYIKIFNLFNDKRQALDFLYNHTVDDIRHLYDKIGPSNRTSGMDVIANTSRCVGVLEELKQKDSLKKIIDYIKKKMNKEDIYNCFHNYSENFNLIIDINQNFDFALNIFGKINDILKHATFLFNKNNDEFSYITIIDNKKINNSISIEEIKELESQIQIKQMKEKNPENKDLTKFYEKYEKLKFFKDISINIEEIYDLMNILRKKGSTLPIIIRIKIKNSNIKYFLGSDNKVKEFKDIQKFLTEAKNNILQKIDKIYKQFTSIRFIYGKQIDNILSHIQGDKSIDSFLRYILNLTDCDKQVKEGRKGYIRNVENYIDYYDEYNNDSFKIINNYILSLFENNSYYDLENYYKEISIKKNQNNKNNYPLKGIYLFESTKISTMEESILQIFLDQIEKIPIAQNILITSKETSYEEIESFFYRAILCKYNTLFVVKASDSFSNEQQRNANIIIDKALNYKNMEYNKKNNPVDKSETSDYMDSCLVFVYNQNSISFINELKKFKTKTLELNKSDHKVYGDSPSKNQSKDPLRQKLSKNTHIIQSEICGLGKSNKIRNKIIEVDKKKYIYLPLGGNISKEKIFKALEKKMEDIKIEESKNVAIHLDLFSIDQNSDSILNEFLFSFLITKFYSNNENIIYIPLDIEIYIEIPNCFSKNFINRFEILSSFKKSDDDFEKNKIKFDNMEKLHLKDDKINLFNKMLGKNDNDQIYKWVKEKLGKLKMTKYSYHQINMFINLFISQYNKYGGEKLRFLERGIDVTKKCLTTFAEGTKYFINGGYAQLLIEDKNENNKSIDEIEILSQEYENDINNIDNYDKPLIFIIKKKNIYYELNISNEALKNGEVLGKQFKEEIKKNEKTNDNKEFEKILFLSVIKNILDLKNPVKPEKSENSRLISLLEIIDKDNYVLTIDNFRKMILILYRLIANIPVILMGETGCGKTALIQKLYQLLNNGDGEIGENGEIKFKKLKKITIDPSYDDNKIIGEIDKINEIAKKWINEEYWVFLDELNTCDSLSLITEMFINREYGNKKKVSENIRFIGACNPYRKKGNNTKFCGLPNPNNDNDLVYLVNILPQSLMYYVFNFGSIDDESEKQYILSIISTLNLSQNLKEKTAIIISKCHQFLRKNYDRSITSLRELARFKKLFKFFEDYFENKKNLENKNISKITLKIKSIIISIYLCYYIRLVDQGERNQFESDFKIDFKRLINYDNPEDSDEISEKEIKNDLKNEYKIASLDSFKFKKIFDEEKEFILSKIELDEGIGENNSLKENIFLLFISLVTKIPLIIIGKPGSSKSLSVQLIYKEMKGIDSRNVFFQKYPLIIQSYFQGSDSTTPEDVKGIFEIALNKLKAFSPKKTLPISMLFFDELGLAERSKYKPLKALHSLLEFDGNKNGISFIGISNWTLDAAKLNRALILSVPDLDDYDNLMLTSQSIVKSINKNQRFYENPLFKKIIPHVYKSYKDLLKILKKFTVFKQFELNEYKRIINDYKTDKDFQKIFDKLDEDIKKFFNKNEVKNEQSKIYEYKTFIKIKEKLEEFIHEKENKKKFKTFIGSNEELKLLEKDKIINVEFHGNRDYYYLLKGIANEMNENNSFKIEIVKKHIERNFSGLKIKFDIIDFSEENLSEKTEEYKDAIKFLEDIKNEKNSKKEIKYFSSENFFKKVYNFYCKNNGEGDYMLKNENDGHNEYIQNIIDNIKDSKSRYLLLEIEPSLSLLIKQKIEKELKKNIYFYEGSPFSNDNNKEYQFKVINQIQEHSENDHILILKDLEQVYAFLYDLFNKNFIKIDGKKYAKIYHGNFYEQLTQINDLFRIIIMVNKNYLNKVESPFLSRFEKMKFSFKNIIKQKESLAHDIYELIDIENCQEKLNYKINYRLKDLLIGCRKEDILAMIYYESDNKNEKDNEDIKETIYNKIFKLLPQDIIINLNGRNILQNQNKSKKIYYNLKDYLDDLSYKISIIYTFNKITDLINGIDESANFKMISEITSENQLKMIINNMASQNINDSNKNKIFIHFDESNSKKVGFMINFIKNNFFKYKENNNFKFIFIIHVKRSFLLEVEETKEEQNKKKDDKEKKIEKIYSVPDIDENIYQLFIDNLNGSNIKLEEILSESIENFVKDGLNELFGKELKKFVNANSNILINKDYIINSDDYLVELEKYFSENNELENKIIKKIKDHIQKDKENLDSNNIIKLIYDKNYINKNSVDFISIFIDFIKNEIIGNYINIIFKKLEENNILTTLLYISKHKNLINNNENLIELFSEMTEQFLNKIKIDDNYHEPKFILKLIIPGFYQFYEEISEFIEKEILIEFYKNEKRIRNFSSKTGNEKDAKEKFKNKNEELISITYNEIKNHHKFVYNFLQKIPTNLILKDYITYFVIKNKNDINMNENSDKEEDTYFEPNLKNEDSEQEIINLLLNLRFHKNRENDENNIYYLDDSIEIILHKINWIKSNRTYIIKILNIYEILKTIFDEGQIMERLKNILENEKIRYITDDIKNPEITTEVNECFYIILEAISYAIIPPYYSLKDNQYKNEYIDSIKKAYIILRSLNNELGLNSIQIDFLDIFAHIYETFNKNDKLDFDILEEICLKYKKINQSLQINKEVQFEYLIELFEDLYDNLLKKHLYFFEIGYYELLKMICLIEIKKTRNIPYRAAIFKKLLKDKEIIVNSNDILQILFHFLVNPLVVPDHIKSQQDIKFYKSINNLLNSTDFDIAIIIENILENENSEIYTALSDTLLYYFEKNSLIFFDNILSGQKNKIFLDDGEIKENKEKNVVLGPLKLFSDCINYLNKFKNKRFEKRNKNLCKLFCIGYIKAYCYKFINLYEFKNQINNEKILKIINVINNSDSLCNIISIYIWKIIYNKNKKNIGIFVDDKKISDYNLNEYKIYDKIKKKKIPFS